MNAKVTIIIPHFNRFELLADTLQSVESQTLAGWEVIVVDDQSNSEQWQKLQSVANERVKLKRRDKGIKGPSACRNIGAREAMGEYLIFLDADDLLAPHCLQHRVNIMERHPDLDAGIFLMKEFEYTPEDSDRIFNRMGAEHEWMKCFIRNENPWNVTCPIWKKDSFLKLDGFDEGLFYMEDPDLHLRALYEGLDFKTFYELPPDCYYRVHHIDNTKPGFYYNSILYRIRFYRKLTSGIYPDVYITKYSGDIKAGVNRLIRTFLYSRRNQFPELYTDLMNWMKESGLYTSSEIRRYKFLIETGNTENSFLKVLKVKGLCYRLLPS